MGKRSKKKRRRKKGGQQPTAKKRPQQTTAAAAAAPETEAETEAEAEAETEAETEAESETEAETEAETEPDTEAETEADTEAARPEPRRSGWERKAILLLALGCLVSGSIALVVYLLRGPKVVEAANLLGDTERCRSCHAVAEHPRVAGHEQQSLQRIGCTPCHGGRAGELDKDKAHGPKIGEARDPFLPRRQLQVACARCHVVGRTKGMERIAAGQRAYLGASCAGCHLPGSRPPGLGDSLEKIPPRSEEQLKDWLISPRSVLEKTCMWSLRDGTYKNHFADTPAGRANLDALVSYLLVLADKPQRQRLHRGWHLPKLIIDRPCGACHELGADEPRVEGKAHRCSGLVGLKALDCSRCHATPATRPRHAGLCPQIAAGVFTCASCHLRDGDGAKRLVESALR